MSLQQLKEGVLRVGPKNLAYNLVWVVSGVSWHRMTLRHETRSPDGDGNITCTRCGHTWKFRY